MGMSCAAESIAGKVGQVDEINVANLVRASINLLKTKNFLYTTRFNIQKFCSEVCHPRCVLKTNGKVNSIRKHNYNCMLDGGIYWQGK